MITNTQYGDYYISNLKKSLKNIDEEVKKEKNNPLPDMHKLLKLEESKILAGLFSNTYGFNERFRTPW